MAAPRAGSLALSLLAVPLNAAILEALAKGPKSLVALRRSCGSPATTTMRQHLRALVRAKAVEPRGRDVFSGAVNFGLTPAGQNLLDLAAVLERWLADAPDRPLELGTTDGAGTTAVLVDGWCTDIVRALAAHPFLAPELDRIIKGLDLAAVERRLRRMRQVGLIEPVAGEEEPCRYQPTPWLRRAIAPLAAAAQWESKTGLEGATPISRHDVESAFLLVTPMLDLPRKLNGTCRLVVDVKPAGGGKQVGAVVTVKRGEVTACSTRIHGRVDSWVAGSPVSWLHAVIAGETESLEAGGEDPLSEGLLSGLHSVLFGSAAP